MGVADRPGHRTGTSEGPHRSCTGVTTLASLLGGIGLFVLGMSMMTEGLKLSAGNALRSILQISTRSALRGLLAGMLITGVVQSSSAVTVATLGFVNAGLLTLNQAVWVVFGTNVGTTMTGWLVAWIGVKVEVAALALPLLGIGMLIRLTADAVSRRAGLGEALAGFGAFFLGIGILETAFADLAPLLTAFDFGRRDWLTVLYFVALGTVLTVLTRSSSAAIAIALTASAGGAIPLALAAAAVIGTNIGTTSTALLAAIGATAPAKRVATAHILFNLATGLVALALLPQLLAVSAAVLAAFGAAGDTPATLAMFHTLFNCLGVALAWPAASWLVRSLSRLYVSPEEEIGRPRHLDATLTAVPTLALRGLVFELARMMDLAFDLARRRIEAPDRNRHALAQRHSGLLSLGQAVRDFIGRLSAGTLPKDVIEALPDLVRTVQHLEDLAALSDEVAEAGSWPLRDLTGPDWQALRAGVAASLGRSTAEERAPPPPLTELSARIEAAYQTVKAGLLRATAVGEMRVGSMEAALLHAQQLRRAAEAAWKARRRLQPWLDRVDPRKTSAGQPSVSSGAAGCP